MTGSKWNDEIEASTSDPVTPPQRLLQKHGREQYPTKDGLPQRRELKHADADDNSGREHFARQGRGVSQIFILIIYNGEKILSNVNVEV